MVSCKLESYSRTEDNKSVQDQVCFFARVSNMENQSATDTNLRLLKYLLKNGHHSPFEMVSICMYIECPRAISRQILRHRSFSFQEHSQRYSATDNDYPVAECRLQNRTNRQSSITCTDTTLTEQWTKKQEDVKKVVTETYEWALENGIAKEVARSVLTESTLSRMYMNGTLRSWIHYLKARLDPTTQKEHREVAQQCLEQLATIFPLIRAIVADDV